MSWSWYARREVAWKNSIETGVPTSPRRSTASRSAPALSNNLDQLEGLGQRVSGLGNPRPWMIVQTLRTKPCVANIIVGPQHLAYQWRSRFSLLYNFHSNKQAILSLHFFAANHSSIQRIEYLEECVDGVHINSPLQCAARQSFGECRVRLDIGSRAAHYWNHLCISPSKDQPAHYPPGITKPAHHRRPPPLLC